MLISSKRPKNIPSNPIQVYKDYKGMGDWIGTFTIQTQKKILFIL